MYKLRNKVKTLYKEKKVGNRGGKGIYYYLVARLIGTILYTGHITVLGRVFCHILPYSADSIIFCLLRQCTGNVWQCTAMCRLLLHAMFCHILPGFCHILPGSDCTEWVECGGNGWSCVRCHGVVP